MEPLPYQIKRTLRASRTRIVVTAEKIEVIAPPDVSDEALHQFVKEKWHWITATMQRLKARKAHIQSLAPETYHHGAPVPYQGKTYPLSLAPTKLKSIKIEYTDVFKAHIPHTQWETVNSEEIRSAIIGWMKQNVKITVEQLVLQHGPKHRLFPKSITIKSQRSRWGSCGIHNDITINWLLALAPLEILEYVVVHELCHIKEKNHSKHFWSLVAQHLPNYRSARLWLKQHGQVLMLGL
ncbi:M48 family metallopeptidase [Methylomicrobium sp. RS1]|uniref:M48 family metallopeptidase n=1 Tax=Candidatus Methylomicrobium oryzae TaxID=2802053 RepID=UPI001920679A|nr:SprT family zinc-dependent metalloprotease [Methylomicrobium sp. RS1]MBL1263244.1 M48 family metallopeptidase [Methylomicrobium sp. RS1]